MELTLEEILDLRDVFKNVRSLKPEDPEYHGLACVVRDGFDCAWVCRKGGCISKFENTGKVLLRLRKKAS